MNKGKNLLDISKEIQEVVNYINKNDEHITSISINQITLNYLKRKGIYGFYDSFNNEIPVIINEFIDVGQIFFNSEKNVKPNEYEPYKEEMLKGNDYEKENKEIDT